MAPRKPKQPIPPLELPPPPPPRKKRPPKKPDVVVTASEPPSIVTESPQPRKKRPSKKTAPPVVEENPPVAVVESPVTEEPPSVHECIRYLMQEQHKEALYNLLNENPDYATKLFDVFTILPNFNIKIFNAIKDLPELKTFIIQLIQTSPAIKGVMKSLVPPPTNSRSKNAHQNQPPTNQPPAHQEPPAEIDPEMSLNTRTTRFLKQHTTTTPTYDLLFETYEVTDADLELILQKGFLEGFSELIGQHLSGMPIETRPIHSFSRDSHFVYVKVEPTRWRKDPHPAMDYLTDIVFDFSRVVDEQLTKFREAGPPEGVTKEAWNDRLDRIRHQASGGVDRIRLIGEICKRIADSVYVEV